MAEYDLEGEFTSPKKLQSQSICLNVGNVLRAKIVAVEGQFTPSSSEFLFELTNDGGTTWNTVFINQWYTFTTTGQDLRYRITGPPNGTITIRQADGKDCLIKVLEER